MTNEPLETMHDETEQRLNEIRKARAVGTFPWSYLSNPNQIEKVAESTVDFLLSVLAERDRRIAELEDEQNVCWHCKVVLIPAPLRCENCPDECDDENCEEDACQEGLQP